MRKRGRPKKDDNDLANEFVHLRLTKKEIEMLDKISEQTGLTKTQILKRGIYIYEEKEV